MGLEDGSRTVAKQQNNNSGARYLDSCQKANISKHRFKEYYKGIRNPSMKTANANAHSLLINAYSSVPHAHTSQDRSRSAGPTFPPLVAAVRQGCLPSYWPTVTRRGMIFWFNFRVKIGTNMVHALIAARATSRTKGVWPNLARM